MVPNQKPFFCAMLNYQSLKNRSVDEQPREKLLNHGKHTLSNAELLGILISSGTKNKSAIDVARDVLQAAKNNLNELARFSVAELCKIDGIGPAKAITILSAIEIGGRRNAQEVLSLSTIKTSNQAYQYIAHKIADNIQEEFWVIYLSRSNRIIGDCCVSRGGFHYTAVDPKVVFKHALDRNAVNIILCHNHPSGNLSPSKADMDLTKKIVQAGEVLEIHVLDHLIITSSSYMSFADEGRMPEV